MFRPTWRPRSRRKSRFGSFLGTDSRYKVGCACWHACTCRGLGCGCHGPSTYKKRGRHDPGCHGIITNCLHCAPARPRLGLLMAVAVATAVSSTLVLADREPSRLYILNFNVTIIVDGVGVDGAASDQQGQSPAVTSGPLGPTGLSQPVQASLITQPTLYSSAVDNSTASRGYNGSCVTGYRRPSTYNGTGTGMGLPTGYGCGDPQGLANSSSWGWPTFGTASMTGSSPMVSTTTLPGSLPSSNTGILDAFTSSAPRSASVGGPSALLTLISLAISLQRLWTVSFGFGAAKEPT